METRPSVPPGNLSGIVLVFIDSQPYRWQRMFLSGRPGALVELGSLRERDIQWQAMPGRGERDSMAVTIEGTINNTIVFQKVLDRG